MDSGTRSAVDWLLASDEPAVRLLARRDVLGEQVAMDPAHVLAGAKVTALLGGQRGDGGFGVHPYRKWTGAHWRLVSLAELGVPAREPRTVAAADQVLAWLVSLCVPRTLSTSCDQAVFVDHAPDASVSPDVVSLKIDRFG